MENYILEAESITKLFPGIIANNDISIKIKKGDIHGLIGENGAGKSTLLKILVGIYPRGTYEGELKVNGEKAEFHSPHDAHKKGIGFVPQEIQICGDLTVAENIFVNNLTDEGRNKIFVNSKRIYKKAQDLLSKNHIELNPTMHARMLSVGQQQLLLIARALSRDPKVLILDEPTASLSLHDVNNLFHILRKLKEKGTSIIFVTHKLQEIMEITDTVTILRDGCNISNYKKEVYDEEKIVTDMIGRTITNMYPKRNIEIGKEVLRIENITVEHPRILNRNMIENVSFTLRKGEVLGLAGLIGAGRTEVLCSIFGTIGIKSGKIIRNGKELVINSEREAIANGFCLVTEDRKGYGLLELKNIKNNITISNLKSIVKRGIVNTRLEKERAKKYFDIMKIKAESVETPITTLSGGNQQKVVVGRALNTDPEIILFDEPTKGIDVGSKNDIYNLINDLAGQGVAIIMVSSELPELIEMCDRFVVMANGTVVEEFDKEDVSEKRIMLAATKSKHLD